LEPKKVVDVDCADFKFELYRRLCVAPVMPGRRVMVKAALDRLECDDGMGRE
jgi:hypothetical protein